MWGSWVGDWRWGWTWNKCIFQHLDWITLPPGYVTAVLQKNVSLYDNRLHQKCLCYLQMLSVVYIQPFVYKRIYLNDGSMAGNWRRKIEQKKSTHTCMSFKLQCNIPHPSFLALHDRKKKGLFQKYLCNVWEEDNNYLENQEHLFKFSFSNLRRCFLLLFTLKESNCILQSELHGNISLHLGLNHGFFFFIFIKYIEAQREYMTLRSSHGKKESLRYRCHIDKCDFSLEVSKSCHSVRKGIN